MKKEPDKHCEVCGTKLNMYNTTKTCSPCRIQIPIWALPQPSTVTHNGVRHSTPGFSEKKEGAA